MDLVNVLTAATSILALVSSLFLWMRQSLREAPSLRTYWSGQRMLWSFRGGDTENDIGIGMDVRFLLGNLSSLPDAVISARVWVFSANRNMWLPCRFEQPSAYEQDAPPLFPINLSPRTTHGLHLKLVCSVPRSVIEEHEVASEESYQRAQNYLGPLRFRVDLISITGQHHSSEFAAVSTT